MIGLLLSEASHGEFEERDSEALICSWKFKLNCERLSYDVGFLQIEVDSFDPGKNDEE